MPFSLHSSLSFASMELWKVLFKVFVQNANDKSLVFASAPAYLPLPQKHRLPLLYRYCWKSRILPALLPSCKLKARLL